MNAEHEITRNEDIYYICTASTFFPVPILFIKPLNNNLPAVAALASILRRFSGIEHLSGTVALSVLLQN